jgi:Ca-activated chloride channel family protein
MKFVFAENAWCLTVVLAVIVLAAWAVRRRRRGLRLLSLNGGSPGAREWLGLGLKSAAVVLIGAAALGPAWGERTLPQPPARGRDLIVVLDVSRSMLAEDATPNRLERARADLADLSRRLERRGGHRLALVTFADRAAVLCPLTTDFRHFRQVLEDASLEGLRLRPEAVEGGSGTQLLPALERVRTILPKPDGRQADQPPQPLACDVLLVSDGGDELTADTLAAAQALADRDVPVYTVGVGDPTRESPIPVKTPSGGRAYLEYQGRPVGSRLEEGGLRRLAEATHGEYFAAGTGPLPVDELLARLRARADRTLEATGQATEPIHRFEWFLLPGLLLLLAELVLPRRKAAVEKRTGWWLTRLVPQPEPRTARRVGRREFETVGTTA